MTLEDDIPSPVPGSGNSEFDEFSEAKPYPEKPSTRPHVIVVGGGVAGMTTAHRLLERGHDVTMLEANAYLGGKLGAHQEEDPSEETRKLYGFRHCKDCDGEKDCSKEKRKDDWHEHCYHMYLNWYHNFWTLMQDIGVIEAFEAKDYLTTVFAGGREVQAENPGSPSTLWQNMTCGIAAPADVFLHSQALLDLLATPQTDNRRLDQISVEAFMRNRAYTTEDSREASNRVLAKAFAAPTALASASSYRSFVNYGARLPEPAMWLLNDHTQAGIFTPWLLKFGDLAGAFDIIRDQREMPPIFKTVLDKIAKRDLSEEEKKQRPSFTLMPLTALDGIEIDENDAFLMRLKYLDVSPGPKPPPKRDGSYPDSQLWRFSGQVVLTIPPRQLGRLIYIRAEDRNNYYERTLAGRAPSLRGVTKLSGAPIMTLDVMFKKPLDPPLPSGIVLLRDSKFEMSVYDNTQAWVSRKLEANLPTQLSICASEADQLMPMISEAGGERTIVWLLMEELKRYIDFDSENDILHCRTHLQTNAGSELFINAVDTWHYRPKTTTELPDLFIAGDFVQNPIDVVTIEGATLTGLMAAEAVRRRTGKGSAVPMTLPDAIPGPMVKMAAEANRPMAYGAKVVSEGDGFLKKGFKQLFPNR